MKRLLKQLLVFALILSLALSLIGCNAGNKDDESTNNSNTNQPKDPYPYVVSYVTDYSNIKNVIFIIGDGMGSAHLDAGELYSGTNFDFRDELNMIFSETNSLDPDTNEPTVTTDSAAAATAMATGVLTYNKVISTDSSFKEFRTILDMAKAVGKSTAVVTTDKLSGATPAAFTAHTLNRGLDNEIIKTQATSGVDLLIGQYDDSYDKYETTITKNYNYVKNFDKESILASSNEDTMCLFNMEKSTDDSVSLKDATDLALNYLMNDTDGFVVMIEQAHIDKHSSNQDIEATAKASASLNETVEYVLSFASQRNDTAVIVTADHETGGLKIDADPTKYEATCVKNDEVLFSYEYTTTNHTNVAVPLYYYGFGTKPELFSTYSSAEKIKNNEIFLLLRDLVLHSKMVTE